MKRIITYLFYVAALLFVACSDESFENLYSSNIVNPLYSPDGTLNVTLNIEMPNMTIATRTMGENPNYDDLKLYVLVFDKEEGLKQYLTPIQTTNLEDSKHNHNKLVTFNIDLKPTEKDATIHLIATDQPDFETQIVFGTEDLIIPSLYTDNNHEAYWQRIALGFNIPSRDQAVKGGEDYSEEAEAHASEILRSLSHVPMIRNFCCVSVTNNVSDFELTGLYVVNTVDKGSVAPYVAGNPDDSKYVMYYDEKSGTDGTSYIGKGYNEISEQGHVGTLPAGVKVINKIGNIATKSESENGEMVAPVYFYERPARVNSTDRTYAIIRGHKKNGANLSDFYYKIDLGFIRGNDDPIGIFDYYNLLRNFDYNINIKAVDGIGYSSIEDAAKGAVFNNFSAAVEARNMKSISDGDDMIFVSFTSYVFTQPNDTVTLLAQYRENISNGTGGIERNDLISFKLEEGNVINTIQQTINHTGSLNAWNTYFITGASDPTDRLRQQTLYIYRGNKATDRETADYGLYRVVTFFSHTPWKFEHINTFSGLWQSTEDMPSWEWQNDDYQCEIGQSKGSPLTLFFELPAGLPQALFPLEFVIESDRQNIQNAYAGNAVVRSVPAKESLFATAPTIGTPTTSRIQYVKTVTWEDYFGKWDESQLVGSGSTIVRCRFLTITDLEQGGIGGSGNTGNSNTTLRVYNPYFGQLDEDGKWIMYHEDSFIRTTATSDPSPRFWDFNSAYWDQIMLEMDGTSRDEYRRDNNVTDELIFVEGQKNSMSNDREGENKDGVRYIRTSNTDDALTHKHTYPKAQDRIIRLEVVSTDDNSTPTAPKIAFYGVVGATMTAPTNPTETKDADDGKKIYIYEIDVPKNVTQLYVDIKPSTNNGVMRFYKVNFYPRWDEFDVENKE